MLTKPTQSFLLEITEKSDQEFQDGGITFEYKYAHRLAHTVFDHNFLKTTADIREFNDKEVQQIECFFTTSLSLKQSNLRTLYCFSHQMAVVKGLKQGCLTKSHMRSHSEWSITCCVPWPTAKPS